MFDKGIIEYEGWEKLPGWHQVYLGMKLYHTALIAAIIGVVLVIFTGWFGLGLVVPVGYIAILAVMARGLRKLSNLPEVTGARNLAKAAFTLICINIVLSTFEVFIFTTYDSLDIAREAATTDGGLIILSLLGALVTFIGLFLLLLCFRRLCRFIGALPAADSAMTALVLLCIIYGFHFLALLAPKLLLGLGAQVLGLLLIAYPILSFVALLFFFGAVKSTKLALLTGAVEEGDVFG